MEMKCSIMKLWILFHQVYNRTSDSCIAYIVLLSVFLIINISMAIYVYFFLYLKINQLIPTIFGA